MTKSISERCMMGLKGLEDQINESTTLEALNSYMNSNIFMCTNHIPTNIEDLLLMDTILKYLNSSKDENIKRSVFNILFMEKRDQRKLDFLVRLASLAVTTLSSSALDILAFWMKNNAPQPLLIILIKRLLTDVLSVDATRMDLLKHLPEASISFTAIFIVGLTDAYQFIYPQCEPPCHSVLHSVVDWISKYKQQLFKTESLGLQSQSSCGSNNMRSTPFPGLLYWTLSHPLAKINCTKAAFTEEDDLISKLHFELISYLDEKIRGSSTYLLSTEYLKYIVETILKFDVPETPQSPGNEEACIKCDMDEHLHLTFVRLAEVVQIGMENDSFQCSRGEMKSLLIKLSNHEYIDAVLKTLD